MNPLKARIVEQILADGPMPVSTYMALCLFDPQHGYYTTREPFGAEGDFTTAPEISQMFGELIGAWLVLAWRSLGKPACPVFAEIGPGRGALAKDIARTLDRLEPGLREAADFVLIEASPRLAEVQANTLEGVGGAFQWVSSVDDLPTNRPLLIVGNELFDAIPARQFVLTTSGWRERCVGMGETGELFFVAGAGSIDSALLPAEAASANTGAIFEIAPARENLMRQIAGRVGANGGAGLFIDYGHLQPGLGDTLQAMLKHTYDDPLANPGAADLTTHVDFSVLAGAVRDAGLTPHLTTQGEFLLALGLLERAGRLGADADPVTRERLTGEVERLAGPDAMGDLFKVLGFASTDGGLPGFPETGVSDGN